MKKTEIMQKLTRSANRAGLKLQKHSPEILIVTGIGLGIVATVKACQATLKVESVVEKHTEKMDEINKKYEDGVTEDGKDYTYNDCKKEKTKAYLQTGVEFTKLYGPSVALGGLSITSILASNNILRKRNVALVAAYTAVDKGFKEYRGRVVERFGKEVDQELRFGVQKEEVETVVKDEDGNEKVVKSEVNVVDPTKICDYSKFFDASCAGWHKNSEYNLMTLKRQQDYANDLLQERGHVFLNEVYDMLGIDRTEAGNIVGWIYDEKNPNGDNFIDFGIYDQDNERKRAFVNGHENVILLDFNVDGVIIDKIETKRRRGN